MSSFSFQKSKQLRDWKGDSIALLIWFTYLNIIFLKGEMFVSISELFIAFINFKFQFFPIPRSYAMLPVVTSIS